MTGRTELIIAGGLIVAAVAFLIVTSSGGSARFFLTVEELQRRGEDLVGRNATVAGAVLGETIDYDPSKPRVTFTVVQVPSDRREVERGGGLDKVLHDAVRDPHAPRLEIVYDDMKPDLLQHEAQAIIRGRLSEDGRFYASEVLLQCPSRYEEAVPGQAEDS